MASSKNLWVVHTKIRRAAFKLVKSEITKQLKHLLELDSETLIAQRIDKFSNMGVYEEPAVASQP